MGAHIYKAHRIPISAQFDRCANNQHFDEMSFEKKIRPANIDIHRAKLF